MLAPPLLWLGVIYIGSLFALLVQSFFSIDDFTGQVKYELTLATYAQLFSPSNFDIIVRTVVDGGAGDGRLRRHRLPDRLLHGALCHGPMEGAVLSRRDAAAVVELSGARSMPGS